MRPKTRYLAPWLERERPGFGVGVHRGEADEVQSTTRTGVRSRRIVVTTATRLATMLTADMTLMKADASTKKAGYDRKAVEDQRGGVDADRLPVSRVPRHEGAHDRHHPDHNAQQRHRERRFVRTPVDDGEQKRNTPEADEGGQGEARPDGGGGGGVGGEVTRWCGDG